MTSKQMVKQKKLLEKIIKKAKKNGYILCPGFNEGKHKIDFTYQGVHCYNKGIEFFEHHETIFDIIFSHDFAKAFWKQERCIECVDEGISIEEDCNATVWKDKLQEMVLCEEPLKYLEKFL